MWKERSNSRPSGPYDPYDQRSFILSDLKVTLNVPANADTATWLDPMTGKALESQSVLSGQRTLTVPDFMIDIVLRIKKR